MAGDVIAQKYRLERCLGEGGQGSVWRAHNSMLELPVAVKLVHPGPMNHLVPERLFREARAAATLGHPSIVRVFDIGQTSEGLPYLVMELLRGESLADWLVRVGRLGPTQALRMLLPIADGLVAAHAEGIIHRDVKPDNIFVSLAGETVQPKLLDFGLARRLKSGDRLGRLTEAGTILGTPAYLSPEQASGNGHVDERADIWAFCATLYECLTGIVPFQGTTWDELRRQILEDEPSTLRDFGVDDAKLWQLLRRGLAKSKAKRWSSMQTLGRALACWLLERGVTSDICGVSLEARWLRSEPIAVSLQAAERSEVAVARAPSAPRAGTRRVSQSRSRRRVPSRPVSQEAKPAPTSGRSLASRVLSRPRRLLTGALGLVAVALALVVTITPAPRAASVAPSVSHALPTDPTRTPVQPEKPLAPALIGEPSVEVVPVTSSASNPPALAARPVRPNSSASAHGLDTVSEVRNGAVATPPRQSSGARRSAAQSLDLMEPY
jgi:serine/threonine-protein kinase